MSELLSADTLGIEPWQPTVGSPDLHRAVSRWHEVKNGENRWDQTKAEHAVAACLGTVAYELLTDPSFDRTTAGFSRVHEDEWDDCVFHVDIAAAMAEQEGLDYFAMWNFYAHHASLVWQGDAYAWFVDPTNHIARNFGKQTSATQFTHGQSLLRQLMDSNSGAYLSNAQSVQETTTRSLPLNAVLIADVMGDQPVPFPFRDKEDNTIALIPGRRGIVSLLAGKALSEKEPTEEERKALLRLIPGEFA